MQLNLSGSGLARAEKCAGSAVLPRAEEVAQAAARGTIFHSFLYDVREHGLVEALVRAPEEYRDALGALDFTALPLDPDRYAAEVAFAYNTRTGAARELGRGLSRARVRELCGVDELSGTADVVSLETDRVIVLDYKTGWADYGPTARNLQLGFYALCAARAYGLDAAHVGLVRLTEDGAARYETADLDFFALEETALRVGRIVEQVEQAATDLADGRALALSYGEHCRRCPALPLCPALTTLARALTVQAVDEPTQFRLTPENACQVHARLAAAKLVLARVEGALNAFAMEHPVPLGDGRVYGRRRLPRDVIDAEQAAPIVRDVFGVEFERSAIQTASTCTKEGLRRALRRVASKDRGLKVEPALRTLLEQLRARGALSTRYTYPVMAHKPSPDTTGDDDGGRQGDSGDLPGGTAGALDAGTDR